ncbi:MAG: pitrilysin family protein [Glaciecola sp.]
MLPVKQLSYFALLCVSATMLTSCSQPTETNTEPKTEQALPALAFEKITLDNGLDVVFHIDRSDPVVAINLAVHVGSSREEVGKTGFAHLFEHLLFLDSENLGYGGLDEMNTRIGGEGTNGFTTTDMTQYFQAVPKDALEKIIWAEADKLGWFVNTVNQNVIDREKQVVKNEKRQGVDNRAYGHNFYVIGKAIYPEGHPYHHQVIGSLDDLENATLEDTKAFFAKWYRPDNVTVTLTGDFDLEQAKTLVKKYFGEVPASNTPTPKTSAEPVQLTATKTFVHEDNFATLPQLTMVWPTVPEYHPDSYALNVLLTYLTEGKRAPFNEVLIDEKQLTTNVSGFNYTKEIAGELYLFINSKPNGDTDDLVPAIFEAFERFEETGITSDALARIKTQAEVEILGSIQSALGKAIAMGEYNVFTGNPGYLETDIKMLQSVTQEDVMMVYQKYIKGKPYVATSFVPKGQVELGLANAKTAEVVEEVVVAGAEKEVPYDPAARVFTPSPSSFDRSIEPPFGETFTLPTPVIYRATGDNGLSIVGIHSNEVPLIEFSLEFDAGKMRAPINKPGLAAITADMLSKGAGTRNLAAFEEALGNIGSELSSTANGSHTIIRGKTLARNLAQTVALLQDMINAPLFDETEFTLLREQYIQNAVAQSANPDFIAARELANVIYSEATPLSIAGAGTKAQIEAISLDDVKAFHQQYYHSASATLNIVGAYDEAQVQTLFGNLATPSSEVAVPISSPELAKVNATALYFYNVPEAKQSVLRLRKPALPMGDDNFARLEALNFPLGGIYTSKLMTELRVNKGYTYGVRSFVFGNQEQGQFGISTSVRTNVTTESLALIKQILAGYAPQMNEADLAQTKDALLRGQALKNETLGDKLRLVQNISRNDLADDTQAKNMASIQAMTLDEAKALIEQQITPNAMHVVVVGDAATQLAGLETLGYGKPVLINP